MKAPCSLAALGFVLVSLPLAVLGTPLGPVVPPKPVEKRALQLALNTNFPDPSIEQDWDGTYYAFATNGNGYNIQVATAPSPEGPWTWLNQEALPNPGSWTGGVNTWAPDVKRMPPSSSHKYIMTYSGQLATASTHHCIGIATASNIAGPYTPQSSPVICPDVASTGGAIDSALYYDANNNKRYIVYKQDGNGVGNGGNCGNSIAPIHSTPIMLQEMNVNDWITPVGSPVQIFDRADEDGPLVEAPVIVGNFGGYYYLTYSSHCFTDPNYDIKYATATNIKGPWTRRGQLLATGDYGLKSPGGATPTPNGQVMLFHANCSDPNPNGLRCMHTVDITMNNGVVTLQV